MRQILIIFFIPLIALSQDYITGKVVDNNLQPLFNATVHWNNTSYGTTTDENGEFKIEKIGTLTKYNIEDSRLIISFIGFQSDTITIQEGQSSILSSLQPSNTLNTVQLTENASGIIIDKSKALKIETITSKELTKAACCDLAGCFETQMSVQAKTTNIIIDSKELSLLGLSGVYNEILLDGIPLVLGLNYTYGVSSIPGTLIEKIYVSQGLASVLQGSSSITGQINIELKKPGNKDLFFNVYANNFGVKQANCNYDFKIGKWKSLLSLHTTQPGQKIDENDDTFIDMPQTTKYSLYNKWIYGNTNQGYYTITTLRFLNEKRIGGQIDFDGEHNKGNNLIYGQVIEFYQPELHHKSSYRFNPNHAIAIQSGISYHHQSSYYGTTHYKGDQTNYNINATHLFYWNTHTLTSGISFKRLRINENIIFNDDFEKTYSGIPKDEKIPGIFVENNFSWNSGNIQLITGLRADNHNEYGLFITPRGLLKYNISENTIARLSIGSGWRTINLFNEHPHLLSSNKNIIISDNLKPEKAFNYGCNILQAIYMENLEIQIILDFYKTYFTNQINPNYHSSPLEVYVDNFEEPSKSNSIQAEIGMEIIQSIGLKTAYNYLDVFHIHNGEKHTLPFTSKHHILNTLSYRPINKSWYVDFNTHWIGQKKLPHTDSYPTEYQRPAMSDPYWIINGQFTLKIDKLNLEIYLGCENILNFRQEDPIISWQEPFGQYFDISNIWGPTKGRELYLGLRMTI